MLTWQDSVDSDHYPSCHISTLSNYLDFYRVNDSLKRIVIDASICHGKPVVRNIRWPVEVILDMLGSGMTVEQVISDHPELEKEDITACINYARLSVSGEILQVAN